MIAHRPDCDADLRREGCVCTDPRAEVETKFWAKVDRRGPDECWPWLGAISYKGYGQFSIGRVREPAHRVAYRLVVGPIPDGLTIDHLCRNRACVNPAHLEPVPNRVNVLRGISIAARKARQTECHRGHPLSGSNLFLDHRGNRGCRECRREWDRTHQRPSERRATERIEA